MAHEFKCYQYKSKDKSLDTRTVGSYWEPISNLGDKKTERGDPWSKSRL